MKRRFLSVLILALILLSSCAPKQTDPLAYQNDALSAEVVFEKNGTRVGAVIKLGPLTDTARDAEIVFTSPESIKGLTLERRNGSVTARLGELCITPDERAFTLAKLFSLDGRVTNAKAEDQLTLVTVSCADQDYELTLDRDSRPKRISGHGFVLDVIWLENH